MTSSTAAASYTLRVIGPPRSWIGEFHIIPFRLTSPRVGAIATTALSAAGMISEPPVSLPNVTVLNHAAAATPEPELEAPGYLSKLYGLNTTPPRVLPLPLAFPYQSERLSLPRMIAPAARSRRMTNASRYGCECSSGLKPPVVGMSAVSNTSFTSTAMPCSGPRAPRRARSASRARASSSARGFRLMTERSVGPALSYASMRARYIDTNFSEVNVPALKAASRSAIVAVESSMPAANEEPALHASSANIRRTNRMARISTRIPLREVLGYGPAAAAVVSLARTHKQWKATAAR